MRRLLLPLVILFAASFAACSYSTDFVVVNESNQPIEVIYRIRQFANEPLAVDPQPAKISASQIQSRDRTAWRKLTTGEFQLNQETRTVTVHVLPNEALAVTQMFHYIGDEDPNDITNWRLDEITVSGASGSMTFTGDASRKSFKYVSRVLYTLTYK